MLITFVVWLIAGSAAWGYGLICFRPESGQHDFTRMAPESVAVRLYFGLLLVSFALLAVALVTNISWWLGLALAIPGVAIVGKRLSKAHPRSAPEDPIFSKRVYFASGLLILAFFVSTVEVQFYDTGLYHQQMAKWLSDFGLVPGIALLLRRYGWTSSWFAAAATLNHGPLRGREAAIIGGLPFALMIMSSAAVAWRYKLAGVLPGIRGLTWSLFCGLLVVISVTWSVESSLSPDIVIWLLPMVITLVLSGPSTSRPERVGLALLLSSLVLTVKLSAAPIAAYCGVLWLWQFLRVRSGRKALLVYLGLATAVVLVLAVANIRTSGCPLYPSPLGCRSGEASVGGASAASLGKELRDYAAQGNRHMGWLVTAALAGTFFVLRTLWNDPFVLYGLAASWSGIVFVLITAPNPRFGMGYLLLPIAMSLAIFVQWMNRRWPTLLSTRRSSLPWVTATVALILLVLSIHAPNSRFSLLLPKRMASADGDPIHVVNRQLNMRTTLSLTKAKLGDVLVVVPQSSDLCWDAALPCTPETWQSIELREPTQGLRGGFRWSSSTALQPMTGSDVPVGGLTTH
jgi:hypothetical protein